MVVEICPETLAETSCGVWEPGNSVHFGRVWNRTAPPCGVTQWPMEAMDDKAVPAGTTKRLKVVVSVVFCESAGHENVVQVGEQ